MAISDLTQPYDLKLIMKDYPYVEDGLLIWSAIFFFGYAPMWTINTQIQA